jgi:cephalosporin hydroxylase
MIIEIDDDKATVTLRDGAGVKVYPFDSPEAFSVVSKAWLRCGWDTKYVYSFTWLGRPIIQLPDDMFRVQDVLYRLKPDVIIETGVAHGGSLIFYASLCKAMGRGRIIGVDVEIRPHNRAAIEAHELFAYITLIEGSSISPAVVDEVRGEIKPGETVFAMLDSNHTKQHVLDELRAYAPMVSQGSYIVVADGIMEDVVGAPRTKPDWSWNNPKAAAIEFVAQDPRFVIEEPPFSFNEGVVRDRVTYWPSAYVKRVN